MKDIRRIKKLNSELNILENEANSLKTIFSTKQKEYHSKLNSIAQLKTELKKLENDPKIKISEHALIRYFERVIGYDLKIIEQKILTPEVLILTETLGGKGTFPTSEGFKVVLKNNTIVTII